MYYNCHTHTFRNIDVPVRFLPLGIVRLLSSNFLKRAMIKLLKGLLFWKKHNLLDRYSKFINIGSLESQEAIIERCKLFYPDETKFVVLSMDLAYMGAGRVPRPFNEQLDELAELAGRDPAVIPFIHIDPRREGAVALLKHYVENHGFKGVKLYPPIGYYPYDKRLDPVYEYCQEKNLPVMTHCSPYGPVFFKGKKRSLRALVEDSITPVNTRRKSKKELCKIFVHPENYIPVVEKFPGLRICFGHFGSGHYMDEYLHSPEKCGNWMSLIRELCTGYENFYTDVSFTMSDIKYYSLLKVLLVDEKLSRKVLFGSDYYMVQVETDERRFGLDLRAFIGEEYFNRIAVENPKVFLG